MEGRGSRPDTPSCSGTQGPIASSHSALPTHAAWGLGYHCGNMGVTFKLGKPNSVTPQTYHSLSPVPTADDPAEFQGPRRAVPGLTCRRHY